MVISMRIAAVSETRLNNEVSKPTLQTALEFGGERVEPAAESTLHTNVMICNSTYEGAELMSEFLDDDSMDTEARRSLVKEQTGE